MKIKLHHGDTCFEFERNPMPQERFSALCKLAGGAIGGVLLLVAVHMVGLWAIVWAVGAMVLHGLYALFREGFL